MAASAQMDIVLSAQVSQLIEALNQAGKAAGAFATSTRQGFSALPASVKPAENALGGISDKVRAWKREETQTQRTGSFIARQLMEIVPAAGAAKEALGGLAGLAAEGLLGGVGIGLGIEAIKFVGMGLKMVGEKYEEAQKAAIKFTASIKTQTEAIWAQVAALRAKATLVPVGTVAAETERGKPNADIGKRIGELIPEYGEGSMSVKQAAAVLRERVEKIRKDMADAERALQEEASKRRTIAPELLPAVEVLTGVKDPAAAKLEEKRKALLEVRRVQRQIEDLLDAIAAEEQSVNAANAPEMGPATQAASKASSAGRLALVSRMAEGELRIRAEANERIKALEVKDETDRAVQIEAINAEAEDRIRRLKESQLEGLHALAVQYPKDIEALFSGLSTLEKQRVDIELVPVLNVQQGNFVELAAQAGMRFGESFIQYVRPELPKVTTLPQGEAPGFPAGPSDLTKPPAALDNIGLKSANDALAKFRQQLEGIKSIGSQVASVISQGFAILGNHAATAGQKIAAMMRTVIELGAQAAMQVVEMMSVDAAAAAIKAGKSAADTPFVGWMIAIPAAAAVLAGLTGMIAGFDKGTMNVEKDQVAQIHKGEVILPVGGPAEAYREVAGGKFIKDFASASTMAVPQFELGTWSVPNTGIALVHQGEAIIPAPLASSARASLEGGGSTSVTFNIQALDGQSVYRVLKKHQGDLFSVIEDGRRNGRV